MAQALACRVGTPADARAWVEMSLNPKTVNTLWSEQSSTRFAEGAQDGRISPAVIPLLFCLAAALTPDPIQLEDVASRPDIYFVNGARQPSLEKSGAGPRETRLRSWEPP